MATIEPWEQLKNCPPESMRKLARMLMSMECDGDGYQVRPAWGNSGYATGKELLAFADYKEGKAERKAKNAKRADEKKGDAPDYQAANRVIDTYIKLYEDVFNSPPPSASNKWRGYAIKKTRNLFKAGWAESELMKYLPLFLKAGERLADTNDKILFGRGDYDTFLTNLGRIQAMAKKETAKPKAPAIPQSIQRKKAG